MWNAKSEIENVIKGRVIRIMFVAVAATMFGMATPKMASAQSVVVYDGPFAMTIPGPCVSTDMIVLTGRMVIT